MKGMFCDEFERREPTKNAQECNDACQDNEYDIYPGFDWSPNKKWCNCCVNFNKFRWARYDSNVYVKVQYE